jgi:hypothetical protein
MAFAFSRSSDFVAGDLRITFGTFTNAGGDTGGDIYTGLQKVDGMILQHQGSSVVADQPAVNETFPKADPITIITTDGADGWWLSWGH